MAPSGHGIAKLAGEIGKIVLGLDFRLAAITKESYHTTSCSSLAKIGFAQSLVKRETCNPRLSLRQERAGDIDDFRTYEFSETLRLRIRARRSSDTVTEESMNDKV